MEATDHAHDMTSLPFSPSRSHTTPGQKPHSPGRRYSQPTQPYVYDSTKPKSEANRKLHPPSNTLKQQTKFASVRQPMAPPCNQRRLNFHKDVSHDWRRATEVHLQRAVHDAKLANIHPNPARRSSRNIAKESSRDSEQHGSKDECAQREEVPRGQSEDHHG